MASSHTGTSTHNALGGQYQVFLSFCGDDTRRGFTNSVYHALSNAGLNVFIDEEGLERGERISGNLVQAIDDSKIYIPIFSEHYASRHWCLRELAMMAENTSKSKEDGDEKVMLPIFYNVSVEDVKMNTPMYKDAILDLEQTKKFDSVDIARWRQALKNVCGFSGLELKNYRGDGHLSDSVVEEVLRMLETKQRKVTKDLVGMKDQIADINKLLDMESGDVRLIGICGMGGMGKTTLAKVIFNQLCPHFGKTCSFLEDVKEKAKTKGLIELQKQLLSDISNYRGARSIVNIDAGIKAIEEIICCKKVLIVLDDVDDITQIQNLIEVKSFCSSTRILVTTRDKSVLNIRGAKYKIECYEMLGLSNKDALKLFSRHAFDVDSPPPDYFTLSKDIVSTTGGLPLALEAIGASLFGQQERKIWEEVLEELRKIPHDNVLGLLQITYDALKPGQQQIFLDIACFFIDYDKTNLIYMWKDCGFGPECAISVLQNRCMIKVLDNNKFWMHDQFRDLGRAISNREHSRLWTRDDIIHELRSTEINTSVQALVCNNWAFDNHTTVTPEQIKRFPHLRLLRLCSHCITFQGDFTGCLSELKWIDLYEDSNRFTATNLNLENVVVMTIYGSRWREDVVISLVEGAKKLKALTLAHIQSLHTTPTFSEDSVLEKLTFNYCRHLKEIDCIIGKLRGLTDLIVENCGQLSKLPEQIGELKHLQHLSLKGCSSLRELPDSVSKLKSLTKLDVSYTDIARLPDSIGTLQSLSSLDLSYTKIVKLPGTMSELSRLQTLYLDYRSKIRELPKLPESLTTLRLTSELLQIVPDLSNLTNLVELVLSDGSGFSKKLDMIQPCDLPWIGGGLSKLRKLHLCLLKVRATSPDWVSLTLMEELTLCGLDLQTLKQLPSNLRVLKLDNTQVKQVELDGLPQLEALTIARCELITRISIPSSLRELRQVNVISCNKLVEVQFLGVLESMERLHIVRCESLERLVCLSEEAGCNELQATELTDGSRRVFLFSSSLKTPQKIFLSWCPELHEIRFVSALESLKTFIVQNCISLKRLGGLSNLKNLKVLRIYTCESLHVAEGIDELERLEELSVDSCRSMGKIMDASSSKVPNECKIWMSNCGEVFDTSGPDVMMSWECYRKKILNAPTQAPDSAIETTSSDWETVTGDPLSEEQDDGNKDDHNEADNREDEDDEDYNAHEVLPLSRGPPPVSSVGDNDENNDVTEESKGDVLKRRGFCSRLRG